MRRTVEEPTVDERGSEHHPAFGMAAVHRVTSTPGAVLFDSEIRHSHYVRLTISGAYRDRQLNRDWIHDDSRPKIEVCMSMAQWGALVSSFNTAGVPVTITRTESDWNVPELPYEPRMKLSVEETREAAHKTYDKVREAMAAVEEKPTKANLRALSVAVSNAAPNVEFTARSLSEHVENVVTKARSDIEAMVVDKAVEIGIALEDAPRFELENGGSS